MVTLSQIITRTGDNGTTGLADGERRLKSDDRIEAYGTVDEANAALGLLTTMLISEAKHSALIAHLRMIQNSLFDIGSDLATPESSTKRAKPVRIQQGEIERLEVWAGELNENLPPLKSFVLPGGTMAAAQAHVARTLVRRAERRVVALSQHESINPLLIQYLNRLSDYLFILSRWLNHQDGEGEPLWQPNAPLQI